MKDGVMDRMGLPVLQYFSTAILRCSNCQVNPDISLLASYRYQ